MSPAEETFRLQMVLDCAAPHPLADFWAAALQFEVEDHTPVVQQLLAAGHLAENETIWIGERQQFADVAACRDPAGRWPRLFLQRVPERKTVKNRMHLDIQVGPPRHDAEVARLTALGATTAWVTSDRGPQTTTMRDPEGNEFCVS